MHAESFSIKHDRSKYLKDCENEKLIDYFDTTNGIVSFMNNFLLILSSQILILASSFSSYPTLFDKNTREY